MRQPRTDDFDPKKAQPQLKSPMDGLPVIEKPPTSPRWRTDDLPDPAPPPQTSSAGKRKIKSRHPFDIYVDQAEELRQMAAEDLAKGGRGSQSAMVREALDDYIAKRRSGSPSAAD
jgi:hypothetical protein